MLDAPENGRIVSCHNGLSQKCVFDCNDGYILIRGSSVRTCLPNSVWDGVETVCQGGVIHIFGPMLLIINIYMLDVNLT